MVRSEKRMTDNKRKNEQKRKTKLRKEIKKWRKCTNGRG